MEVKNTWDVVIVCVLTMMAYRVLEVPMWLSILAAIILVADMVVDFYLKMQRKK